MMFTVDYIDFQLINRKTIQSMQHIAKLTTLSFNLEVPLYRLAKYINMIVKNIDKIDKYKSQLFNEDFSIQQLYKDIDQERKGYITDKDFIKILKKNGADLKVIEVSKIQKYFSSNNKITKFQFMKAITLPPWKMLEKSSKNTISRQRVFHKFLITLFLAIQEDDIERQKIKNINFHEMFKYISSDGQSISIHQIEQLLVAKKFSRPDSFTLLRFMHNKLSLCEDDFTQLFKNDLPERFQSNTMLKSGVRNFRVKKKDTNDTDLPFSKQSSGQNYIQFSQTQRPSKQNHFNTDTISIFQEDSSINTSLFVQDKKCKQYQ